MLENAPPIPFVRCFDIQSHFSPISVQDPGPNSRSEVFQALVQILDLILTDVANISHEVCDIAARIRHLLVDIVVAPDLVDSLQHTRHVLVDVDNLSCCQHSACVGVKE